MVDPSPPLLPRVVLVIGGLAFWFTTQRLIKSRPAGEGKIVDVLHTLTAPWLAWLTAHPRRANALLIVTTLLIDALGLFVIARSLWGPTVAPIIGMLFLFGMRQLCQLTSALPIPEGCVWRSPGVPSILVTYDVANDLFFSGHTAMAVFGAIELARWGGPCWAIAALVIALFESLAVIVLRAHYTLDVYAGAVTAVVAVVVADALGPACDRWLIAVASGF